MKREPKQENLAKLTPEQRVVFDNWQREAEQADVIMQAMLDALAANDKSECSRLANELDKLIPATCEHGHSVYLECMACEAIEKTLFPENYDKNGDRINNESIIDELFGLPKSNKTFN